MEVYDPYYYQIEYDDGRIIEGRRKKGDFDGCGEISNKDILLFYLVYKNQNDPKYSQYLPVADMNDDGIVDTEDLKLFEELIKIKK